jgi:sugar (pentulose or hexulose) kinase
VASETSKALLYIFPVLEYGLLSDSESMQQVGISCFAMSLVGIGEDGDAVTPVYTYADARNQA